MLIRNYIQVPLKFISVNKYSGGSVERRFIIKSGKFNPNVFVFAADVSVSDVFCDNIRRIAAKIWCSVSEKNFVGVKQINKSNTAFGKIAANVRLVVFIRIAAD